MSEAINQLNNLPGSTLGEIFHSLNTFIKNNNEDIRNNLEFIFSNFEAENPFQKLVKIRLITEYNCYDEVLNALRSDSTFYISHVLQCSWFFKNSRIDPENLVNSVFPSLSYSTRTKMLKKYSKFLKNTSLADTLFALVKHRYGLSAAFTLLPACSEELVRQVFETISIQIPTSILLHIYKTYPSLVVENIIYLLESCSTKKRIRRTFQLHNYDRVFSLIASKDPVKFSQIVEKYNNLVPYMKLGKRATRHFLHSAYDSYKNHVKLYKRHIIWKNITANLRLEQISTIHLSVLPRTPTEFIKDFNDYSDFMALISSLRSEKVKQEIIVNNFQKVYGKPISDYLNSLSFNQVCFLPSNHIEVWVKQKIPETEDHRDRGKYTAYLPEAKAVSEMKNLISSESDIAVRGHLLKCLIKIIFVNDNPNLVGPIFQYLVKRHRNERIIVKQAVFEEFSKYKKILQIPEAAWGPIEEFYNIMILENEATLCFNNVHVIISKQIEYRLERGLPVQEYLEKLMKLDVAYYKFNLCQNTRFEKQCLMWFIDWFPEKKHDTSNKQDINLDTILDRIFSWNSKHPDDRIQLPEWLKKRIEIILTDPDVYLFRKSHILTIMEKGKETMEKYYTLLFPKVINLKILQYHLRRSPLVVKENHSYVLKELLGQSLRQFKPFLLQAVLYTPFGIPQAFCEYCLNAFHKEKEDSDPLYMKENTIEILSFILPSKKFVEMISDYYPSGSKFDDFSDEAREKLQVQKLIAGSFKWSDSPLELLDSLAKFAVGDYTKFVIGSINSILLRIREDTILPKLNEWLHNSPVSTRKHFIRAFFKIAPIENTLKMLLILFEKETNISLRLLFLENSLKFFLREPSSETFSVLRAVIDQLKSADETALSKLYDIECVPDKFLSEYLQLLWDKVSTKNDGLIGKKRSEIIGLIDPIILISLSEEFCDVLISEVLSQEEFPIEKQDFVVQYLLYSSNTEQQDRRLAKIIPKLKKSFDRWNEFDPEESHVFLSRNAFSFFVNALVRESLKSDDKQLPPSNFLAKFSSDVLSITEESNVIEEMIFLDLSRYFMSTKDNFEIMSLFLNHVEAMVEKLSSVYGVGVIDFFKRTINSLFCEEKVLELSEQLISRSSKVCNLLGIMLLPKVIDEVNVPRYEKLIKTILHITDNSTKIYVNRLFKELRSTEK